MAAKISGVHGREVLDSRGNPTLEVELVLSDGSVGRAIVPSGASKGEREALELRDGDKRRFLGKGVRNAAEAVDGPIAKAVVGKPIESLGALDRLLIDMDGTPQKSKLGGNTILGVSLAYAHAVAASRKQPLFAVIGEWMGVPRDRMRMPVPLMNVLNGGLHANNGLEFQEFMIVPHGFGSFPDALRAGCEVFQHLKNTLHDKHLSTAVGDEGGFAPTLDSNTQALEFIAAAVKKAGYQLGKEVAVALDVASSSFYEKDKGSYAVRLGGKTHASSDELMGYYEELVRGFPIVSIEDGLDENDWRGWVALTKRLGGRCQLVGDDIFVTQTKWVKQGIEMHAANAVLIKVNQVGSLTETFETMRLCREAKYGAVVSHRSGETEDVTIAHLAVGSGCGQIKTGSASRSERMAKYNELLRIDEWARKNGGAIPYVSPFT